MNSVSSLTIFLVVVVGLLGWMLRHAVLEFMSHSKRTDSSAKIKVERHDGSATFDGRVFQLKDPWWWGFGSRSPNGRWMISWIESDIERGQGGNRERGRGAYLLYDLTENRIVKKGQLERPNNGHVADNGIFLLEDWLLGGGLQGTLYAFAPTGQVLLKRKFTANLATNMISKTGKYAVCQTCNSETEDSGSLFLFDVKTGKQLFSASPDAGWTSDYDVDEESVEVVAHIRDVGAFRYDRNGVFIDAARFREQSLESKDPFAALRAAEEYLSESSLTQERGRQIVKALDHALNQVPAVDIKWQAEFLKWKGIAHEALGEATDALNAYEKALSINPKVGVKRRAAALAKHL
jgi:tetratricopeptide (TPR) repeat protein